MLSPFPVDSSGIQRVMGLVSMCQNRTSDFRGTGDAAENLSERASLNVYHTSSLAARLLLSNFSASAVGIIRQIRQYVRRYVRNQTRVK